MPNCYKIDPLVTPFIDGDLPDADRRTVEDHLHVCPPCHSRVVAEREVHELIRTRVPALKKTQAPDSLHAKCWEIARLKPQASDDTIREGMVPPVTSRRLAPYALAASLVLVVGGAFVYQATDKSARVLAAELTADHMKCIALNHALGTHDAAAAAVESAMASGFDWRVHLPEDASKAGLELVGSRPCLYGEGKIAHIMYRHEGHPVSLFMLPKSARREELVEVLGHQAKIWCVGNRTFVLLASEPRANVERIASFVQASLR